MYRTLEDILADTCEGVRPPERLSVSEAAAKYRYLNNPGSFVGPWDNHKAPYLVEVMDTLTSNDHTGLIFAGPARCGKALALDTPIATPAGWRTMGDLRVGDRVFGKDGKPYPVMAKSDVFEGHRCYEVVFSDGAKIVADAGHKWEVNDSCNQGKRRILTTEYMSYRVSYRQKDPRPRFSVDGAQPTQHQSRFKKLTPRALGRVRRRNIVEIREVESVPTQCISVGSPDNLFLAGREMVPTHNSDIYMNWLNHTVICDPADMMVVHMTQSTARDWSTTDLAKAFRHTKTMGDKVAKANSHDVTFRNGMKLLVKWPTITELSGKTIPRIWLMDMDRMPLDIDKEGSPYQLAKKRTQTFRRFGMTVAESSPGFHIDNPQWKARTPHEAPPTQGILSLYNRGDRRRWYWRCLGCGESYEPDFKHLKWPESEDFMESAEQAYMACPHCGTIVHHDESEDGPGKHGHNLEGRWLREGQTWGEDNEIRGKGIRSEVASFWLKGPAAMFTDWKTLVYNYLQAYAEFETTGSEEALKTTVNVDQGLPYLPIAMETDRLPEELKSRSKDLGNREVPEGVRFLVASIDVQRSRFVVQVHGFGPGGDIWTIDRFDIRKSKRVDEDGDRYTVNPAGYIEDWQLIYDDVMLKTYPLGDGSGRHMQIKGVVCDSGGREGVTKNAYDFYRWLRDNEDIDEDAFRRFLLLKGASSKSAPRVQVSYPDSDRKDRHAGARGEIPVLFMNVNLLKDQLNSMLDREDPGGGMVHFPEWLEDWFYAELTAERRTSKGWENPRGARNESWDLMVYAIAGALSRIVRMEQIDWDTPPSWADDWEVNDLVIEDENNKRFASKEKSEYDFSELAKDLA